MGGSKKGDCDNEWKFEMLSNGIGLLL
jgi:hypothetical protein